MSEKLSVKVNEGEAFESALRRFKKLCEKAGILAEVRKREAFEKPSVRRKKKSLAARKRNEKKGRKSYGGGRDRGDREGGGFGGGGRDGGGFGGGGGGYSRGEN